MKCSRFSFGGHFLWSFFRASLGKFGQKSFASLKICVLAWSYTYDCTSIWYAVWYNFRCKKRSRPRPSLETPSLALASWVDCYRFMLIICLSINANFALCVQHSRLWSSNKRSKLFFTELNARVSWIRPTTRVGDKSKPPTKFCALFQIFKQCYADLRFVWNAWTHYWLLVF